MTELTIVICTYKRSTLLRNALQSLRGIEQIEKPWELLIVDNAGDSGTKAVAEEFSKLLPIRYVIEPKLGISHARNKAITEARAPIILFTDDDVTFHSSWLSNMHKTISEHSECDFWGGQVEPVWLTQKPTWFDIKLCPVLANVIVQYDLGNKSRYWNPKSDNPFVGANFALRVTMAKQLDMFDAKLGVTGGSGGSGEDSLFIKKISQSGSKGWYVANAKVLHPVSPERISKYYTYRYAWQQGKTSIYLLRQEYHFIPRWLYRIALEKFFKSMWQYLKGIVCLNPAECFAGQFTMLFNLSKLCHAVFSTKR